VVDDTPSRQQGLAEALTAARAARRGVPPSLEAVVRAHASHRRKAGLEIGQLLVEVKALVRDIMSSDELVFMPKVVGWTVAGYFGGSERQRDEA